MRTYVVQPGDSPAKIAIEFAGCPKCARDLILANPHKAAVQFPNGFLSFRELHVGEKLTLPDKWFSGELDALPPEYFAALPYPDGVTPPKSSGVGAPVSSELVITAEIAAMHGIDPCLQSNVFIVCDAQRSMGVAVDGKYGPDTAASTRQYFPDAPSACSPRPAWWAASGQSNCVPGAVPAAPKPAPAPAPAPETLVVPVQQKRGLSTGEIVGLSILGVGAAGGIYYWMTQPRKPLVRRVREEEDDERDDRSTG